MEPAKGLERIDFGAATAVGRDEGFVSDGWAFSYWCRSIRTSAAEGTQSIRRG